MENDQRMERKRPHMRHRDSHTSYLARIDHDGTHTDRRMYPRVARDLVVESNELQTHKNFGDLRLETDQRIGGKSSPRRRTQVKTSWISFVYITSGPMLAWKRNPVPLRCCQCRKHGNSYLGRFKLETDQRMGRKSSQNEGPRLKHLRFHQEWSGWDLY